MEIAAITGLVVAIVTWCVRGYLGEYTKTKGKNLADKQDIKHITELVESVKQENQLILEQMRSRQQLRIAAAERRLQAHQDAFQLWRKLLRAMHRDEVDRVVVECVAWWDANCLFLSAEARGAFHDAIWSARDHAGLLIVGGDAAHVSEISKNMARIKDAGPLIIAGADLPSLGERETKDMG